ncbi:ABC transporter permease [Candidatus Saccharibacteria bacterium]|nr:ABC transporter permease [Candidatus Saccharibacteria bacterium]
MIAALRSEFRKLLTIRSTYVILLIALGLEFIFAFYVPGWKINAIDLTSDNFLASQVVSAVNVVSLLIAIVAILAVTHEYRYNTVTYTLTASNSRTKVFFAKFIAVMVFTAVAIAFYALLSPLLSVLAINLNHRHLGVQVYDVYSLAWRSVLAGVAMSAYGFILAMAIRIQVGALAALFFIPSTVESLLGLILKENAIYLPFGSLNALLGVNTPGEGAVSYTTAALTVGIYVVGGFLLTWFFFLKRDAN